jgi:hypothetical protein
MASIAIRRRWCESSGVEKGFNRCLGYLVELEMHSTSGCSMSLMYLFG